MCRNEIFVLIYHCHQLLHLNYKGASKTYPQVIKLEDDVCNVC
jgi:hypothetical protein